MASAAPPLESSTQGAAFDLVRARFTRQALLTLLLTLGVVLFGAVVRITGSGAGCGQHWPSCQGEIVHLPRSVETVIELSHRVTSGASALAVFWLALRAHRIFGRSRGIRSAALAASAMMVVEALLGAALVKLDLVGMNASVGRAVVMPLHLVSTSVLLAALAFCVWWVRPSAPLVVPGPRRFAQISLFSVLLTSGSGALTALGDTVYPVQASALTQRLLQEPAEAAHFLERLRVLHPAIAVVTAVLLFSLGRRVLEARLSAGAQRFARAMLALTGLQLALGTLNVLLSAPGWMQVIHLGVGSLVWVLLALLTSELYAPRA